MYFWKKKDNLKISMYPACIELNRYQLQYIFIPCSMMHTMHGDNYQHCVWRDLLAIWLISTIINDGRAVGNVSGYICVSDCRSRGREFDPGPVPYFRGDWSWNDFYSHSPPFRWFIQEGLLSVTSESMCTNYWWTVCSSLPRKKCGFPQWT